MARDAALGDASAAVAVVRDTPVKMGKEGGVDAADPAIVKVGGVLAGVVLSAVGGDAAEELDVGFEGKGGEVQGDARTEEGTVDVAGEIAADVGGDSDGTQIGKAVVGAKGTGGGPAGVVDLALFGADGSVDRESGLGMKVCGED